MKTGDYVTMSEEGIKCYKDSSSNPRNKLGKVVSHRRSSLLDLSVSWPNNHFNTYKAEDITLLSCGNMKW